VLALQEAVGFYSSALESISHLNDLEATARAHMGLGEAYAMLGLLDRFYESYAHALATWEQLGERERVAAVRFRMGMFHVFRTEYRQAHELAQAGLRDLADLEQPDKRVVAQGHVLWATALSNEGRALKDAQAHLSQAIQLYEQTDDYDGRCQAQIELGNIAAQEGEVEQAAAYYAQALENAQRGKEMMSEAMAWNNAAYHSLLSGDLEKANQLVQRGWALAEAHNITPVLLHLYNTVAEIRLSEKRWGEAEEFLKQGMALAEQLNSPDRRVGYLANFAEVAYGRGEHPVAIAQLTAATQFADQIGARHTSARYHIRLAEMLGEQGNWPEAESHLQRGKQIAQEGNYRPLLERAERISRRNR
jgi:tetratricopeptide (TPR) repeat protein